MKTKDRPSRERGEPGMLQKTKELFAESGNVIEKKGG
jgi:hypothetical protein